MTHAAYRAALAVAVVAILAMVGLSSTAQATTSLSYQRTPFTVAMKWDEPTTWKTCPTPRLPVPTRAQRLHMATLPGKGSRVLVVGDSLIHDAYSQVAQRLMDRGWIPTVVCWGGKHTNWGLRQMQRLNAARLLPKHVVVALGTNDVFHGSKATTFDQSVASLLTWARERQLRLTWVNTSFIVDRAGSARANVSRFEAFNAILRKRVERMYSNGTRLVDWNRLIARTRASWIGADGIHDTSAGSSLRAITIARAVMR